MKERFFSKAIDKWGDAIGAKSNLGIGCNSTNSPFCVRPTGKIQCIGDCRARTSLTIMLDLPHSVGYGSTVCGV